MMQSDISNSQVLRRPKKKSKEKKKKQPIEFSDDEKEKIDDQMDIGDSDDEGMPGLDNSK